MEDFISGALVPKSCRCSPGASPEWCQDLWTIKLEWDSPRSTWVLGSGTQDSLDDSVHIRGTSWSHEGRQALREVERLEVQGRRPRETLKSEKRPQWVLLANTFTPQQGDISRQMSLKLPNSSQPKHEDRHKQTMCTAELLCHCSLHLCLDINVPSDCEGHLHSGGEQPARAFPIRIHSWVLGDDVRRDRAQDSGIPSSCMYCDFCIPTTEPTTFQRSRLYFLSLQCLNCSSISEYHHTKTQFSPLQRGQKRGRNNNIHN